MADPAEDEILLTALLDGELPEVERDAVSCRLRDEPALRARLEELRRGGDNLQAAFTAMLEAAPTRNLQTKLHMPADTRRETASRRPWALWAAAIALVSFLAGGVASRVLAPAAPDEESWRQSVAEYMDLYTPATFAAMDEASLQRVLGALSDNVGVDLSAPNLRSGDLQPRVGFPLQFKGAPLVEIGYVADGKPAAFCVIRNGEPDAAPTRERHGAFNAVSWAKAGRGFLVISAAPADQVEALAASLQAQTIVR